MRDLALKLTATEARILADHLAASGRADLVALGERITRQSDEIERIYKKLEELKREMIKTNDAPMNS